MPGRDVASKGGTLPWKKGDENDILFIQYSRQQVRYFFGITRIEATAEGSFFSSSVFRASDHSDE